MTNNQNKVQVLFSNYGWTDSNVLVCITLIFKLSEKWQVLPYVYSVQLVSNYDVYLS